MKQLNLIDFSISVQRCHDVTEFRCTSFVNLQEPYSLVRLQVVLRRSDSTKCQVILDGGRETVRAGEHRKTKPKNLRKKMMEKVKAEN